ncbi:unnamed protein product [Toxocara canis]|uniref:Kinesin motor domain-containing protein n=1 Tax=Toxocara canis TaxID=6265 RepID=A0A183VGP0_TOXCA|nr:unnamed protein product [Toxocara canis]
MLVVLTTEMYLNSDSTVSGIVIFMDVAGAEVSGGGAFEGASPAAGSSNAFHTFLVQHRTEINCAQPSALSDRKEGDWTASEAEDDTVDLIVENVVDTTQIYSTSDRSRNEQCQSIRTSTTANV